MNRAIKDGLAESGRTLAACGSGTIEDPPINPVAGTFVDSSVRGSKPPRWLVGFEWDEGTWRLTFPSKTQGGTLAFLNARAGRDVAAVTVRVRPLIQRTEGWVSEQDWEWLLFGVLDVPLPDGTSSETLSEYSPATASFQYQHRPRQFAAAGLVALFPDHLATAPLKEGPQGTYGELTQLLSELLRMPQGSAPITTYAGLDPASFEHIREVVHGCQREEAHDDTPIEPVQLPLLGAGGAVGAAIERHNQAVERSLRRRLSTMKGTQLERYVAGLFECMGFEDVKVTAATKDKGVDIRALLVVDGAVKTRAAVQVKGWEQSVGRDPVAALRGSMKTGDIGIFVTTSTFTRDARDEAARTDVAPISLIDGGRLLSLCLQHDYGVERHTHEVLALPEE